MSLNKVDAFGHPYTSCVKLSRLQTGKGKIVKYGLEHDKETGTTIPVVAETVDLAELVSSFVEQTGVENVMRLIRSGQLNAEVVADDGKHGADLTQVPTYAGDLLAQQQAAEAQKDALCQALGIESLDGDINEIVNKAVEAKLAAIQAQADAGKKEGE